MSALRKLFFGLNITWPKLLIFAIVAGVVTGIVMQIPILEGTSIQNIGITVEMWVLLAMIICTNSKKPLEAACKTIVFFLISQPLVYLTMWPIYHGFPWGYYRYWFYFTLATFPMALLAWYIRKQNIGSMLIVTVVCTGLMIVGISLVRGVIVHFPLGLLSVLFCIAQAVVYWVVLIDDKRKRIAVAAVSVVLALAYGVLTFAPNSFMGMPFDNALDYNYEVADEGIVQVWASSEDSLDFRSKGYGTTTVKATKADGTSLTFTVTVGLDGMITVEGLE